MTRVQINNALGTAHEALSYAALSATNSKDAEYYKSAEKEVLAALSASKSEVAGWIVGNGTGLRWRCMKDGLPGWTGNRSKAIRYARRADAEAAHRDDDEAWIIVPFGDDEDASKAEAVCEDCGRHIHTKNHPASGWLAACGKRLTRLEECGNEPRCISDELGDPVYTPPVPAGSDQARSLIKEACGFISDERDDLFQGHQVHGELRIECNSDRRAASLIADLDNWLERAGQFLNGTPSGAGTVCPLEWPDVPSDILEFGARHGIERFAEATYVAGYRDAQLAMAKQSSPVPSLTDDDRVKQLEAEKSILMGALAFAIDVEDHYDRLAFLQSFTDGSADEDEEWKDWQSFKANLVLNGTVAKQAFPEPPAITDEAIELTYRNWRGKVSTRRLSPERIWHGSTEWHPEPQWLLRAYDHEKQAYRDFALKDFGVPAITDEAVERMANWLSENFTEAFFRAGASREVVREVARAALLAAFPSKGEGE